MSHPKNNNKQEIIWNIINSVLVGAISFFSSVITLFSSGGIKENLGFSIILSFFMAGLVAVYKFKDYWDKEEREYCKVGAFNII